MPLHVLPILPVLTPQAASDVTVTLDSQRTQKLCNAMMSTNVSKVLMIVMPMPRAPTVSDHSTVLVTMAGLVMVNHAWTLTNVLLCSSVPWVHPNHAVTLDNVPTLTVHTLVHV
jgi:23S rRNA A2030 N6-methylase RlmJ